MSNVKFGYGVLVDRLEVQANMQGYDLNGADKLEKLRDSVNRLYFVSLITGTQHDAVLLKLNKMVLKNLVPKGGKDARQ